MITITILITPQLVVIFIDFFFILIVQMCILTFRRQEADHQKRIAQLLKNLFRRIYVFRTHGYYIYIYMPPGQMIDAKPQPAVMRVAHRRN